MEEVIRQLSEYGPFFGTFAAIDKMIQLLGWPREMLFAIILFVAFFILPTAVFIGYVSVVITLELVWHGIKGLLHRLTGIPPRLSNETVKKIKEAQSILSSWKIQ